MQITINPSSGVPIFKQIGEQLERMILGGKLAQGDFLPSVRQLALELQVNPMTISKTYSLLEERGLVERQRGVGMTVASLPNQPSELQKIEKLDLAITSLILQTRQLGLSDEILKQRIELQLTKTAVQPSTNKGE